MIQKNLRIRLFTVIFTIAAFAFCGTLTACPSSDDSSESTATADSSIQAATIKKIEQRGKLLVGTTGDYRPLSFYESETKEYWGFGIEIAKEIAKQLSVEIEFVKPRGRHLQKTSSRNHSYSTSLLAALPSPIPAKKPCS